LRVVPNRKKKRDGTLAQEEEGRAWGSGIIRGKEKAVSTKRLLGPAGRRGPDSSNHVTALGKTRSRKTVHHAQKENNGGANKNLVGGGLGTDVIREGDRHA